MAGRDGWIFVRHRPLKSQTKNYLKMSLQIPALLNPDEIPANTLFTEEEFEVVMSPVETASVSTISSSYEAHITQALEEVDEIKKEIEDVSIYILCKFLFVSFPFQKCMHRPLLK